VKVALAIFTNSASKRQMAGMLKRTALVISL
jgi:hypothetical protein